MNFKGMHSGELSHLKRLDERKSYNLFTFNAEYCTGFCGWPTPRLKECIIPEDKWDGNTDIHRRLIQYRSWNSTYKGVDKQISRIASENHSRKMNERQGKRNPK